MCRCADNQIASANYAGGNALGIPYFIEIRDFFNFYEISCSVLILFYVIGAINRFKTIS